MRSIVQVTLAFAAAAGLAGAAHGDSTVRAATMDALTEKSAHTIVPLAPDVAKTPTPGGPVPIPYPNLGQGDKDSGKKAPKATVLKNKSHFKQSTGDEAGTQKAKVEGSPAILLTPLDQNTPPGAAARQTPKTDFGSILGRGLGRAADAVLDSKKEPGPSDIAKEQVKNVVLHKPDPQLEKAPKQPLEPVKQPVVVAPKNPIDTPLPVKLAPLPQPVVVQPVQALQPQPVLPVRR